VLAGLPAGADPVAHPCMGTQSIDRIQQPPR
jgi:hypothetical protein